MLMSRYADMNYFNSLPLRIGTEIIRKAVYEKQRGLHWDMWLQKYPHMNKQNFIPFDQFFTLKTDDLKPHEYKPKDDILKQAEEIQSKIQNGQFTEATF